MGGPPRLDGEVRGERGAPTVRSARGAGLASARLAALSFGGVAGAPRSLLHCRGGFVLFCNLPVSFSRPLERGDDKTKQKQNKSAAGAGPVGLDDQPCGMRVSFSGNHAQHFGVLLEYQLLGSGPCFLATLQEYCRIPALLFRDSELFFILLFIFLIPEYDFFS